MEYLYAFYFNYDTFESAASLISLHRTIEGVYKAMREFITKDYLYWYDDRGLTGKQVYKHSFGKAWYIIKLKVYE